MDLARKEKALFYWRVGTDFGIQTGESGRELHLGAYVLKFGGIFCQAQNILNLWT